MKTRRRTRSEPFWPSIIMKKWLNIKPKVHEFSEDEVDTETESEDDDVTSVDHNLVIGTNGSQSVCPSQNLGTTSNDYLLRHRRRKSGTLRVQHITMKDIRVTIGTWNVAGRVPCEDLEIEEWLCTSEPADFYVLGFQEVVPLNAGNVLGSEDRKPILRWEAIIRRTLNKSQQSETKMRTSAAAAAAEHANKVDAPQVKIGTHGCTELANDCSLKGQNFGEVTSQENKYKLKRIYKIDNIGTVEWPEISLDTPPHALSSNAPLRRDLSSYGKMGFSCLEKSVAFTSQDVTLDLSLKRVRQSSGNLELIWTQQQKGSEVVDSLSDVSNLLSGTDEEESYSENAESQYEDGMDGESLNAHTKYVRIVSKQMVGIYVSIWVRKRLRRHINHVKVTPVGVGIMGYMGNKGSVSISLTLFQTKLCFVCCHLTSGSVEGDQQRRNSDVYEILRRTQFSPVFNSSQPKTIPEHDQIFWFGDLNYRLNMVDADVRKFAAKKQWAKLIDSDQLCKEMRNGHVFEGWKEGVIEFPPTYKYEINSNTYVGENPKEGGKKRSPAWCDRILWSGKGIKQLSYGRAELRLSDHRPLRSIFVVEVEVFDHPKLERALNFTNVGVLHEDFLDGKVDCAVKCFMGIS